jgi:hypothetical protein
MIKPIIFYVLSIVISWLAVGAMLETYHALPSGFYAASEQPAKTTSVTAATQAPRIQPLTESVVGLPASATEDEEEESDVIPVTIMMIPSPQPMAKPPKSGKDAAPPPMDI